MKESNKLDQLLEQFMTIFSGEEAGIRIFHAPGRVNLIGEHIDYNGGYVFPAALTFGTTMLIRRREDDLLNFASTNFPLRTTISTHKIAYDPADEWANYPKGIALNLQREGLHVSGYDILFHGEIPNASGLSSSASIEVVTGYGLLSMENMPIDTVKLALLAQKSENEFNGVNCGIMDQFAVANGKRNHAILLNCDTLEYQHVPIETGDYKIVISNTHKQRGLVDSEYNLRRAQCEQAVRDLQTVFPHISLLGELSAVQFNEHAYVIADEIVRNRARHVIEENERVIQSMASLKNHDLASFGQLMNASHRSLRDLFTVTGKQLDVMNDAALKIPGVLGSRMTGAGFGGCTVSIVHEDQIDRFKAEVGAEYQAKTGIEASFYVCEIGDGVKEIKR